MRQFLHNLHQLHFLPSLLRLLEILLPHLLVLRPLDPPRQHCLQKLKYCKIIASPEVTHTFRKDYSYEMHYISSKGSQANTWRYLLHMRTVELYSWMILSVCNVSFLCFGIWCPQKNVIPAPAKVLINRLAELGQLYGRVDFFIRQRESAAEVGMIEQSLCHHLQAQLTEYYRLIAILETQMTQNDDSQPSTEGTKNNSGLSLRRLDVWINEWRMRMRMMSVCVEGAKSMSMRCSCPIIC